MDDPQGVKKSAEDFEASLKGLDSVGTFIGTGLVWVVCPWIVYCIIKTTYT